MFKKISLLCLLLMSSAFASDDESSDLEDVYKSRAGILSKIFDNKPIAEEEKYKYSLILEKAFRLDQKVNQIFLAEDYALFPFMMELALEQSAPDLDPKENTVERFMALRAVLHKETGYLAFRNIFLEPANVSAGDLVFLSVRLDDICFSDDFPFLLKKYLNVYQGIVPRGHQRHRGGLFSFSNEVLYKIFSYLDMASFDAAVQADECFWFFMPEQIRNEMIVSCKMKFFEHFKRTVASNYKDSQGGVFLAGSLISDLVDDYRLVKKGKGRVKDYKLQVGFHEEMIERANEQFGFEAGDSLSILISLMLPIGIKNTQLGCALSNDPDEQEDGGCQIM